MGFFKDLSINNISHFVSSNTNSAVHDASHLAQQYVNNPITNALAPAALGAIGIPPQVYGVIQDLQNKSLNGLQGIKKAVAGTEYGQYIQSLTEQQYQEILKKNEEDKKQQEEKKKQEEEKNKQEEDKKNQTIKNNILIISGVVFLILTTSFVTYKLLKKK